jgi:hypothetical protein
MYELETGLPAAEISPVLGTHYLAGVNILQPVRAMPCRNVSCASHFYLAI